MLAFVRAVPDSFPRALAAVMPDPPLDVARARRQHAAYCEALTAAGAEVIRLPADESCPDCCFIEDMAIVAGGIAVIPRPGAESRRAEVEPVAEALARHLPIVRMPAPGTVDGGDCMLVGKTLYVGASARSNEEGRRWLRATLGERGITVVDVAMPPGVLHLKSVSSPLDDTVLLFEGTIPPSTFDQVIVVPEEAGSNAVVVGRTALIAAGSPVTRTKLEAAGWKTVEVDTSELRRADSALTCLSVLV